jgi:hypothetical protein
MGAEAAAKTWSLKAFPLKGASFEGVAASTSAPTVGASFLKFQRNSGNLRLANKRLSLKISMSSVFKIVSC